MKTYIKALIIGASLTGLTGCNDYLDREPEDKLIPETFFTTADNLLSYTLNFYTILPSHSSNAYQLGTFSSDNGTDNQAGRDYSTRFSPGEWLTSSSSANWSFTNIRRLNYFFNYAQPNYEAGTITGSPTNINQAMGEAHFLRAYSYWAYYSAVGDYPIIDGLLPDDKETLLEASVRQPRNKVARYILDDLQEAINLLPENSSYGKNGLTKDCARVFRSRVALFEGTWLKYHKGTALVPGGPGWPGDASLLGSFDIDSEISYFLTEAMKSAKEVGDKFVNNLVNNTASAEGEGPGFVEQNPYFCMFNSVNPGVYDEVLMYRAYSLDQGNGYQTQIQAQFQKNAGGTGWTRGMVNSFLMSNGLPIYAAGSGYDPAWEDQGVDANLQGRDSRIVIFTKGDNSIITYGLDGNSPAKYRMGWLMGGETATCCPTGYAVKKGQGYDYAEASGNLQSVTGSITFRAVEGLLNYMEACVELNGSVDGTAGGYWRAIRNRAKVDPDYSKTIAATNMTEEAKWDWGAYSHGALVSPTLYNVRRERRNELCAEAQRMLDLRRWCALDQMITTPYQIEGIKYWGTVYNDPNSPLCLKYENGSYITPVVDENSNDATMSSSANSLYVRPYQISKVGGNPVWDGYHFTRAHYLSPIGHQDFVDASPDKKAENSVIYQNPGWSVSGSEPASNI
ncbi:MAG: RagB/SusD family nutrient uptake outer membrane protein [Muribaculaceae bacterium]|nr:RagB/SusD family nutrient uptake outer membrane protein [Muribaculaceae bacterium]